MQSSSGRRSGPWLACIDRLITLGVIQLFVNIRRKRYIPHFGKIWFDWFRELDQPFRTFEDLENLGPRAILDLDSCAYTQTLATHQSFPGEFISPAQQ